jgi:hypothetical protein
VMGRASRYLTSNMSSVPRTFWACGHAATLTAYR